MATVTTRAFQLGDVGVIAANLTLADRATIFTTVGHDDLEAEIRTSVRLSGGLIWTVLVDGTPAGLFGAADTPTPGVGAPWMLCTPAVGRAPVQVTRQGRAFVRLIREKYQRLENFEDDRNTPHLRWLQLIGFEIAAEPEPCGVFGAPFRRFWMN